MKKDYEKAYQMNLIAFENAIAEEKFSNGFQEDNSIKRVDDSSYCNLISMYYDSKIPSSIKKKIKGKFAEHGLKMPWRACGNEDFIKMKLTKKEQELEDWGNRVQQQR